MTRSVLMVALAALACPSLAAGQQSETYRLTLGDAARLAAERSSSVLEARARADGARARVRGSLSDLLPTLDADAVQSARTFNTASFGLDFPTVPGQDPFFDPDGEVVGPVNGRDVRMTATIPLLDLSAIARRRSARAGAEAASVEQTAVGDAAATRAATAYLSTLRARADVTAREEDLALAEELLVVAQGQLEAGVAVAIDVTRAQSQVATIRAQLIGARHQAETATLTLLRALHLPGAAAIELTNDLAEMVVEPLPPEDQVIAEAIGGRSDLRTAQAYEAAAEQAVSATRAGRLPTLTARLDDGFYGESYGHLLNTYAWTVSVSIPVFDGLERSSRVLEQEARVRELNYRIDDMEEEVAFQVRQSLLALGAAQELAAAAAERLRLAELEVGQEQDRLRAGVIGTADVVRAAMRLNAARTAQLDALASVHSARVRLAAARGTITRLP